MATQKHKTEKPLGLAALQGIFVFGHLSNDWLPAAIWLLAPAIGLAFDLKPSEVGLLLAIHSIGASLAYFPAGVLADRTRLQGRLLLGTFWWVALGYLLASTAPSFWSLAILLAIGGMGDAAWHPIATGILVRQMPKQRGQALGVHAVGGTLAEVLSPLLVGFLLAFLDWRVVLQISVIPAALMGIAFLFIARRIPSRHASTVISRADLGAFITQWRSRTGLFLIAGIATYNMALIALMTMSPLFMQRELGFNSAQTGMAFAAAMLAGSIGQPIVGRLSDRRGRFGIFAVGSVVAAGLAGTVVLFDAPVLIIGLLTMAMAVLVTIRSGVLAMAVDHASKHEATALGFVFVVLDGVGALGAVLAGLVGDFSLVASFGLAGGLSLLAVGFIATARR
ncbi:MAG: MFS transporter [Acidiferrobacteraceae bacterium]|nr:MFS transporter [Acidiferrobacteraceae bacterium]MBT3640392.1 MFS transporter [Acidiferrobacteraceae bacterium]MBT3770676.1 MFS transporter [Acidiferrobacteraceae bacterium]MBT3973297.1 MFS transporter [Acidiferrobacteraceae bacterium]MBT4394410.1 MFS transporter [Acidiferrobacteraceae bacterium]